MSTVTPSMARGIRVTPRNPPFVFVAGDVPEHWLAGDPLATAAWNALSVIASAGEKLFVDAGRQLLAWIDDPVVAAETRAFLQQEAIHSSVHARFNDVLRDRGLPVAAIERLATELFDDVDRIAGRAVMISAGLAGEQMIGEMGHALLEHPEAFDGAAEGPRAMWMWHFFEEVEHQSALHDGFVHVFGGHPGARAHRVLGAAYTSVLLAALWPAATWAMLSPEQRARTDLRACKPLFDQLLGDPGLLRGAGRNVAHLWRTDFHPFQMHDDPAGQLARHRHRVDSAWERPLPSAGRHGEDPNVPRLGHVGAADLTALARYTRAAARRTRAFVSEVRAR